MPCPWADAYRCRTSSSFRWCRRCGAPCARLHGPSPYRFRPPAVQPCCRRCVRRELTSTFVFQAPAWDALGTVTQAGANASLGRQRSMLSSGVSARCRRESALVSSRSRTVSACRGPTRAQSGSGRCSTTGVLSCCIPGSRSTPRTATATTEPGSRVSPALLRLVSSGRIRSTRRRPDSTSRPSDRVPCAGQRSGRRGRHISRQAKRSRWEVISPPPMQLSRESRGVPVRA